MSNLHIAPAIIDPIYYAEVQAREQQRDQQRDQRDRFMPPPDIADPIEAMRTDIPLCKAHMLRAFAASLIDQKRLLVARSERDGSWRHLTTDSQEILDLSREAAEAIEPVIQKALQMADTLEASTK